MELVHKIQIGGMTLAAAGALGLIAIPTSLATEYQSYGSISFIAGDKVPKPNQPLVPENTPPPADVEDLPQTGDSPNDGGTQQPVNNGATSNNQTTNNADNRGTNDYLPQSGVKIDHTQIIATILGGLVLLGVCERLRHHQQTPNHNT